MSTYRDWPTERSDHRGLAVLLPGRNYQANMALMKFAGLTAEQHGWQVREVSWEVPWVDGIELIEWAVSELKYAVDDFDGRVLVVGKSMASLVSGHAGRMGYEGLWLTPVLTNPAVVSALSEYPCECFLLGGTADPLWSHEAAEATGKPYLEIAGGDHSLFARGDAVRTAEMHLQVTKAINGWLASVS